MYHNQACLFLHTWLSWSLGACTKVLTYLSMTRRLRLVKYRYITRSLLIWLPRLGNCVLVGYCPWLLCSSRVIENRSI
ncbi:hypothetical protein F4815DRAFT_468689 [Daldinia loculata]|nr:hypothetical protein F4815DRAFT_468689 [Daldinia loculata]